MHSATPVNLMEGLAMSTPRKTQPWLGDEDTPNCVIVAVANHLLHTRGITADAESIQELYQACDPHPTIEEVLWEAWLTHWPRNDTVHLRNYKEADSVVPYIKGGMIIGYKALTEEGWKDHCALSLAEGKVVSWGEVADRDSDIDEAWELWWE